MIILVLGLLIIILSILLLTFAILLDITFIGHDFTTTKEAVKQVSKILFKRNKQAGVFYDFGCCRGEFLIRLKKYCPNIHATGIDSSWFRIWLCRLKSFFLHRKVNFIRANFFVVDISKADVIYVYLNQPDTTALEEKIKKELKPGSLVITNTQSFPNLQASETVITHINKPEYEKLFVYEKF